MERKLFALLIGGSIFVVLILLAFFIVYIVGLYKLFKKAGKQGWEAIVPFYNTYVLIQIAGLNWWYFLISISSTIFGLLGIVGFSSLTYLLSSAVNFFIFWNIGKKMKQNHVAFAILGTLFCPIMIMIIGLSSSYEFDNSIIVSPNGPISDDDTNKNNNSTTDNNDSANKYCTNCGNKIKPDSKFCENCGKKVD